MSHIDAAVSENVQNRMYLNEEQVSKLLCVSKITLQQWRHYGRGPAYHKFGRAVRYLVEDLEAFAQKRRVDPIQAA